MATISGSVGANASKYSYWIEWSESSVDINNNTSVVSATVYVQKVSNYNAEGSSSNTLYIDGTAYSASPYVDMNPETGAIALVSGSKTITHNSDGSKSISISASSSLPYGSAYGPSSGSASATVSLTTIPREAYITNSVSFTVGNNIPLTLVNAGNFYVKADLYVNSTLIKSTNLGQVTSATFTLDSTDNANIYAQMPSSTSTSMYIRIRTYSNSGYTTQIGGNRDKTGTVSIDTVSNRPTFTTYTLANVDKTVNVVDKYGNTLVSSSTDTLLGSSTKMIKGYSKVRGTITTGNKAVAQNSATMVKYRFTNDSQYAEAAFSSGSTVDVDLDNVNTNTFAMTAFDSRSLSTEVAGSLSLIAEYTPLNLFSMALTRDNSVDPLTKLSFAGVLWNKYFGSNSGTATGVQNTLTTQYRWRLSTRTAFEALDGTCTISIATPAVVSKTGHGLSTGDIVYLTTTGALPTGLSASTYYWVIYKDADSFYLATSLANAQAGTKINTSGSQSGTHTLRVDGKWTTITPSVDGSGNITFDDYIDGDLGASGFSDDKSFVVEVRGYDKLSHIILELVLSVGIPLMDLTKNGVAFKSKYDDAEGGPVQVNGLQIGNYLPQVDLSSLTLINSGWIKLPVIPTRQSTDDPVYVLRFTSDISGVLSVGMKIKIIQNSTALYFIIHAIGAYSSGYIDVTVYGGTDYDVGNTGTYPITEIYFSLVRCPYGFPMAADKWSVVYEDTGTRQQHNVTANTVYNLGSQYIDVPIGNWSVDWELSFQLSTASTAIELYVGWSTSTSTFSSGVLRAYFYDSSNGAYILPIFRSKNSVAHTDKTRYYLIAMSGQSFSGDMQTRGGGSTTRIQFIDNYL